MATLEQVTAELQEIKELLRRFLEGQQQATAAVTITDEIRIAEATGDPLGYWKARGKKTAKSKPTNNRPKTGKN